MPWAKPTTWQYKNPYVDMEVISAQGQERYAALSRSPHRLMKWTPSSLVTVL
jgi:hypothetical protein